ncbi:hypothetical protein H0E87_019237 [Populus deltoides]|uniref:Uncharacterized protein n=1 Tax=Populus deltoides TaxID=3696 RepID=A0A8T2XUL3_POPDE|nr:hypothetical protein H0E87_019237 [Populus deltoides]
MSLSIFLILSLLWRLEGYLLAYWDVAIAKQVTHTSVPMGRQQELMIEKVCEISDKISSLENLSLSKQVDSLFSQPLRGILESHFSNLIGSHEYPLDLTGLFPY